MPNHCENTLNITGTPEDLRAFREFARSPENGHLDINKFVPMPQEFRDTDSSNPNSQSSQILMEKYGAPNWHAWACNNWGTKWGAYETSMDEVTHEEVSYQFFTAWAPFSEDCMTQVAARFPGLKFHLEYNEPRVGFQGYYVLENGALTDSHTQDIPGEEEE